MIDEADVLSDLDQIRSRYEILRRLGFDGRCAVHAAKSPGSNRHFAVSVIGTSGTRRGSSALYLWQAHTMEPLKHPKLMVLHAVHHLQGGTVAVAMERRRGCTLAERLDSTGPLGIAEAEAILRSIGEGLAYLHGRGVVHRRVRPESVFLDRDFGYARLAPFGIRLDDNSDAAEEAVQGTLAYLAPEQAEGPEQVESRKVGPATDLYSLGLVGYAMLTGRRPWSLTGSETLPGKTGFEALPPLSSLRPEAPARLCRAIEGCLAKNPRRRWGGVEEFLEQLDSEGDLARTAAADAPGGVAEAILQGRRKLLAMRQWKSSGASLRRVALALPGAVAALLAANLLGTSPNSAEPAGHDSPEASASSNVSRTVEQPRYAAVAEVFPEPPASAADEAPPEVTTHDPLSAPRRTAEQQLPRSTPSRPRNQQRTEPGVGQGLVLLGEPISR